MWDSRQLPMFLFRLRCWRALFFYFFFLLQILKNITWYAERVLTEISLGSLLILVVIRTIQYNMTRTRVRVTWSLCEFLTSAAWIQLQTGGGILLILLQPVGIWFCRREGKRSVVLTKCLWTCNTISVLSPSSVIWFSKDLHSGIKLIFSWEGGIP